MFHVKLYHRSTCSGMNIRYGSIIRSFCAADKSLYEFSLQYHSGYFLHPFGDFSRCQ